MGAALSHFAMNEVYNDPQAAFEKALASGRSSHTVGAVNYVGDFMYMGSTGARDHFKHRATREYIK
jgi:hypothetical protein